ncbi:MAG: methyltransferase [Gammaproteobacteria bacterium]|nr:methyltransferase [Gammaproteobacteria bacterium]
MNEVSQKHINPFVRALTLAWLSLLRPWLRRQVRRTVLETIDNHTFVVLPEVHNPVVFRSGAVLGRAVAQAAYAAAPIDYPIDYLGGRTRRALDMGTGCGVGAVFAAHQGYDVVAVDINPDAVRCARINALTNRCEDKVDVRHGDLFAPVAGEQFDLVLFNPPFFVGESRSLFDQSWRGVDVLERFARGLPEVLLESGQALIVLSTDGVPGRLLAALEHHQMALSIVMQRHLGNEIMTLYRATRSRKLSRCRAKR